MPRAIQFRIARGISYFSLYAELLSHFRSQCPQRNLLPSPHELEAGSQGNAGRMFHLLHFGNRNGIQQFAKLHAHSFQVGEIERVSRHAGKAITLAAAGETFCIHIGIHFSFVHTPQLHERAAYFFLGLFAHRSSLAFVIV